MPGQPCPARPLGPVRSCRSRPTLSESPGPARRCRWCWATCPGRSASPGSSAAAGTAAPPTAPTCLPAAPNGSTWASCATSGVTPAAPGPGSSPRSPPTHRNCRSSGCAAAARSAAGSKPFPPAEPPRARLPVRRAGRFRSGDRRGLRRVAVFLSGDTPTCPHLEWITRPCPGAEAEGPPPAGAVGLLVASPLDLRGVSLPGLPSPRCPPAELSASVEFPVSGPAASRKRATRSRRGRKR